MTDTSNRGLGSENMSQEKKDEIHKKGGHASSAKQDMSQLGHEGGTHQGRENNPGNFANRPTSEVQDAGRRGGENSHGGE